MTPTEDGAKPTAHRISLNTPDSNPWIRRPLGTIRTGQSHRPTTVAVSEPIGRAGRSAPAAPMTTRSAGSDLANFRICVPGSPCLIAAPVWAFSGSVAMGASRSFIIMSLRSSEPRLSGATIPSVTTTCSALSSARRARAMPFAHSSEFMYSGDKSIGHRMWRNWSLFTSPPGAFARRLERPRQYSASAIRAAHGGSVEIRRRVSRRHVERTYATARARDQT